jgi:hypothetical protein
VDAGFLGRLNDAARAGYAAFLKGVRTGPGTDPDLNNQFFRWQGGVRYSLVIAFGAAPRSDLTPGL